MSIASLSLAAFNAFAEESIDRSVLPNAHPPAKNFVELDVRNTEPPELFAVTPPEGAPNVLIALVDDLGFARTSTFGGPVTTPTFDQLAAEGVRFVDFHTTEDYSPTAPKVADSLVTYFGASVVQQVFHVSKRNRKTNIQHHG